ncbi:MAG: M20 family peptidase [Parvibaculaceae bacterium]
MKRIGLILAGLVGLVIIVALTRTFMAAAPESTAADAVPPVEIDAMAAANHLGEAIRFKTLSTQFAREETRAPFVAFRDWMAETYPALHAAASREIVSKYSLFYTWPGTDPSLEPILLMSHMDVVPIAPGTEQAWEVDPFSGTVADGFIWGRGAIDTKGSLIAILEAAEHLAARGYQPRRTVHFAFGHDEEVGGLFGDTKIAEMLKERGVRLHWVADEGGIVANGLVPGVAAPVAMVGVAEKGYVTLDLTARAQGGHSSMPPAETAIGRLARAIDRLQSNQFDGALEGTAAKMMDAIAPVSPFAQRLALTNRWLFGPVLDATLLESPTTAAMMRTTIAPTMIGAGVKENVLPASASAKVNFRIHPRDTVESIVAHVTEAIDDEMVEVSVFNPGREASQVSSTESEGFRLISQTVRDTFPGAIVAPNLVVGGTDARHFEIVSDNVYRFIPIILGPDDTARFHGTNERITVENMGLAVQYYVRLIERGSTD